MKLRNKETGEIAEASILNFELVVRYDDGRVEKYPLLFDYSNFENYEEPKEHWCINEFGTPEMAGRFNRESIYDKLRKLIGNDFETEEEARQAVEKLKAWSRLKGHNLRVERGQRIFVNANNKLTSQKPLFVVDTYEEVEDDLDLLFGGEDDDDDYMPTNAEINDLTDIGYGG